MVALAYTDITPVADAATMPARCPAPARKTPVQHLSGDPLIDAATRLLSVPLRQAYALLWRVGLLVVDA